MISKLKLTTPIKLKNLSLKKLCAYFIKISIAILSIASLFFIAFLFKLSNYQLPYIEDNTLFFKVLSHSNPSLTIKIDNFGIKPWSKEYKIFSKNVEISYENFPNIKFSTVKVKPDLSFSLENLLLNNTNFAEQVNVENFKIKKQKISGDLHALNKEKIFLNAAFLIENTKSKIDFEIIKLNIQQQYIEKYFPKNLKLNSGELSAKGEFLKNKEISVTAFAKLTNVSGAYNNIVFKNGSFEASGELWPKISKPLKVKANEINVGIDLTQAQTELNYDSITKDLAASNFQANTLGGQISIPFVQILGKEKFNKFTLSGKELSLDKISDLYSKQGYKINGKLNFIAPMKLDSDYAPICEDGSFGGQDGTIKIDQERILSLANSSNALKNIYQFLSDFKYSKLDGKFNYDKNGDLKVMTKIIGRSSKVDRPIDFNLGFEDNIPMLLRSLRLAKGKF